MPLTHDIGVRIPYPLLKTDNFGCLFFLFIRLLYAELATTSPYAFRLYVLASKLAYSSPKTLTCGLSFAYSKKQNYMSCIAHSELERGWADMRTSYCSTCGLRLFFKVSALRLKPFESIIIVMRWWLHRHMLLDCMYGTPESWWLSRIATRGKWWAWELAHKSPTFTLEGLRK